MSTPTMDAAMTRKGHPRKHCFVILGILASVPLNQILGPVQGLNYPPVFFIIFKTQCDRTLVICILGTLTIIVYHKHQNINSHTHSKLKI